VFESLGFAGATQASLETALAREDLGLSWWRDPPAPGANAAAGGGEAAVEEAKEEAAGDAGEAKEVTKFDEAKDSKVVAGGEAAKEGPKVQPGGAGGGGVRGKLVASSERLFTLSARHRSGAVVSADLLTAELASDSEKGLVFGSRGFSSGVHYWEVKVERCGHGTMFIGVAPKGARSWGQGFGFQSYRATLSGANGETPYGELGARARRRGLPGGMEVLRKGIALNAVLHSKEKRFEEVKS